MTRQQRHVRRLAMTRFLVLVVAAGIALWFPTAAEAHSYKLGDIAVGHVWAPPPASGGGVPVYGPILNRGQDSARLVGASTPIAEDVRFRIAKDGEVSWPKDLELSPGKPLGLAPWREHIWISGLKQPLKDGDAFELTLDFGDRGQLTVKVVVEKAAGH